MVYGVCQHREAVSRLTLTIAEPVAVATALAGHAEKDRPSADVVM